jgi:hypothetical protein
LELIDQDLRRGSMDTPASPVQYASEKAEKNM